MATRRLQAKVLGRLADMRQAQRDVGMEALAGLRQDHLAVAALEELGAELLLQPAHGVGDGRLRHAKLTSGGGKAG